MPPFRGWSYVRRLQSSLQQVADRAHASLSLEMESDYGRLILIEASGYIEASLQELLQEVCRKQASGPALNYAISQLEWSHNPTTEAIEAILKCFSPAFADRWESMLGEHPDRKAALNSVVGLRNKIAHGTSISISLGRVLGYLLLVDETVEWLIALLDPAPDSISLLDQ